MDQITAQHRYLFNGHRELLTPEEAAAWRNLQVERMIALCEFPAVKELFRSRWINNDPNVLNLLRHGADTFLKKTLSRLEGQTQHCPECRALCRTSRAKICPECSHSWF
ncbi:hypothetical protein ACFPK9_13700 [Rubritalea spongiae]|uniref:Uncharacterized protein n=1 Tax=Rubritalea spongiae TaxID=430797 RepID=A0ABW5E071_9BACT